LHGKSIAIRIFLSKLLEIWPEQCGWEWWGYIQYMPYLASWRHRQCNKIRAVPRQSFVIHPNGGWLQSIIIQVLRRSKSHLTAKLWTKIITNYIQRDFEMGTITSKSAHTRMGKAQPTPSNSTWHGSLNLRISFSSLYESPLVRHIFLGWPPKPLSRLRTFGAHFGLPPPKISLREAEW
jgi:hypothetical protein